MLSENQIKIILILLNHNDAVLCSKIARDASLSTRTIKSNIQQINEAEKKHNLIIYSNTHRGYWIESDQKHAFMDAIYNNDKHSTFPNTRNRRVFYMGMHTLKYQNGTPSLQSLANEFFVSKSTISNDVQFLKEIASASGDLTIKPLKTGGIFINGSELALRHFYSSLIMLFYDLDSSYVKRCIMETFGAANTATPLHEILIRGLEGQGIQLADSQMNMLTFQIIFAAYRIQTGHTIKSTIFKFKPSESSWFKNVEKCLNITFPDSEIIYIASLITNVNSEKLSSKEIIEIDRNLAKISKQWFSQLKKEFKIDLSKSDLINDYLYSLFHNSLSSSQLIKDKTVFDHPFAYSLSKKLDYIMVKNRLKQLSQNSIIELTALLTVVLDKNAPKAKTILFIDAGKSTRDFASYRIEERFSYHLDVLGAYPLHQINNRDLLQSIDFMLCTSHSVLEWSTYADALKKTNKKIVFISTALTEMDMLKIHSAINEYLPSVSGATLYDHK